MVGQTLVEAALEHAFDKIVADLPEVVIVVEVLNVLVIRDVSIHGRVTRLTDVVSRILIHLVFSSIVNGLLDDLPSQVVVRDLALEKGRGS